MYPFQETSNHFHMPSNETEYMDIVDDNVENYYSNNVKPESANDDVQMKEARARRQNRHYTEEEILQVCKLYFVDNLSIEASGKAVGMPRSTAGNIIRRQREKLGLPMRRTEPKSQKDTKNFEDTLADKLKIMLYDKEHPKN